jgi:putative transposase
MPKGLKRVYGFGHLHFLTFSCYRRLPLLGAPEARNTFIEVLADVRGRYGFKLVGYVVMPEHVHLLMSQPARGTPSTVLQVLKQDVSGRRRRGAPAPGQRTSLVGSKGRLPQFWQSRFYDFNVWSQKKKVEKLAYMHLNPVKRGLVAHPKDWPWSSYAFYERRGEILIGMDPVE